MPRDLYIIYYMSIEEHSLRHTLAVRTLIVAS